MQGLRSLGFPGEFPSLEATALGNKYRDHRWEDRSCRGLRVRSRLWHLSVVEALSPYQARVIAWRSLLAGNFFSSHQHAQQQLTNLADPST